MEAKLIFRKAIKKDFEKILEFYKIVEGEFVPPLSQRYPIEDEIKKVLTMPDNFYLIAEDQNREIIALEGFIENYKGKKGQAYLSFLAVHPNYRGKGTATFLKKKVLKILKKDGMKEVHTRTWSTNKAMIELNKKLGFEIERIVKDERGPGIDSIYFKKRL